MLKLSLTAMIIAGALFKAAGFLFVSLMNLVLPPYGGAYIALLTSIYPGYDPVSGPLGILVGTFYSLIAGALAGLLFGWIYNIFAPKI
ncbi:MAG TPA: hypothetical protein VFS81_20015 [Candidatus Binatia bacterium]|nr:hypothetical protein [Candidatus Binatia bacterium]